MVACCPFLVLWLLSHVACGAHSVLGSNAAERPFKNPDLTFKGVDPVSGAEVTCDKCPPGKFLRRRCTASSPSVCEDCPPGSFTELWNYIGRCLSCGVCSMNMVQSRPCSRQADCSCQCRPGYYYKESAGMCVSWSECGTGSGVSATGTSTQNTQCAPCANGTFSDQVSSQFNCSVHTLCQAPRSKVVLRGTAWHDTICTSCEEAKSYDPVHFLRRFLPSFFSHHALSLRRLRQVISKLPSADGSRKHRRSVSGLNQDQLRDQLDQWILESSPDHLRTLPLILTETGAVYTADRLKHKLGRIQSNLNQVCPPSPTGPGPNQDLPKAGPELNQDLPKAGPGPHQDLPTAGPGLNQDLLKAGPGPHQDLPKAGSGLNQDLHPVEPC